MLELVGYVQETAKNTITSGTSSLPAVFDSYKDSILHHTLVQFKRPNNVILFGCLYICNKQNAKSFCSSFGKLVK